MLKVLDLSQKLIPFDAKMAWFRKNQLNCLNKKNLLHHIYIKKLISKGLFEKNFK